MLPPNVPFVTPTLARSARDDFQQLYDEQLSDDDGQEIATNVLGVHGLLSKWRQVRDDARAAARFASRAASAPSPAAKEPRAPQRRFVRSTKE